MRRSYCMLIRAHVLYYPEKGASLVAWKVGLTIEGNHSYWGPTTIEIAFRGL